MARRRTRLDPASLLTGAGRTADPWQADLVRAPGRRTLLCCSRSSGKSTAAAALALARCLNHPPSLALVLSPSERQSGETMLKVWELYAAAGRPVRAAKETELELRLANGSRLVALPGTEKTVRTYNNVAVLIVDEAARVPDELYKAVRPMLAVSGGSLLALSTPFGRRGWFWEAWEGLTGEDWSRVKVTAGQCPRIPAAFLEQERKALGEFWFRQEYECDFLTLEGAEFPPEYFPASIWFTDWPAAAWEAKVIALDPSKGTDAKKGDYAAFCFLGVDPDLHLWADVDAFRGKPAEFLAQVAVGHVRTTRPDRLAVEANQWQSLFCDLITAEADRQRVLCPVSQLLNREKKIVRLRRLGEHLRAGRLHVRDTPGGRLLVEQLQEFPVGAHDDCPDALEMAVRVAADLLNERAGAPAETVLYS